MFTEKMSRLTSDFTARILDSLRAASLAELAARRSSPASRSPKKAAATKKTATKKTATKKTAAKKTASKAAPKEVRPERDVTIAALSFFVERGSKGATAHQLSVHLGELGLGSKSDVIGALATEGAIRDAGFRRSTGTGNKTATVYVSGA